MTRIVTKSPRAFIDLDAIAAFIGEDNPQAAIRFLDLLEAKFRLLAEYPSMAPLRPDLAVSLRAFPARDYVIFYRESAAGVEVVRVLHGARDIEAIFDVLAAPDAT